MFLAADSHKEIHLLPNCSRGLEGYLCSVSNLGQFGVYRLLHSPVCQNAGTTVSKSSLSLFNRLPAKAGQTAKHHHHTVPTFVTFGFDPVQQLVAAPGHPSTVRRAFQGCLEGPVFLDGGELMMSMVLCFG